jgi:hypothetical protein
MSVRPDLADLITQAHKAVAGINDPKLKEIAFEKALDDLRASRTTNWLDSLPKVIQVVSIAIAAVISVVSFSYAQQAQAKAAELDSAKRRLEAAQPFLILRQKLYFDAVQAAGVLANQSDYSKDEVTKARARFRQLYVAELALVESKEVESRMVQLASAVDSDLTEKRMTEAQRAAFKLAHALRDSMAKSWGLDADIVDNPQ